MPKLGVLLGSLLICTGACVVFFQTIQSYVDSTKSTPSISAPVASPIEQMSGTSTEVMPQVSSTSSSVINEKKPVLVPPIANAASRITKKPFGIHVTPKDSPVSPERFSGYHTGTDFETTPEEQNIDIPISAFCDGKILRAGTASGYGGIVVQSCVINGQDVTVVYGHLRASSIQKKVGNSIKAGEVFAVLGKGYSSETDGERKHLHLGIVKGKAMNVKGYVSSASALNGWLDYQGLVNK